ncbi:MAG: cytochrome b [Rehaibacterium terrae]|uniref:cytochrome b n=1 Tax=Rehaibacterium terrae TaxID=1341696 RepID=UPI00391B0306
MSLHQRLGRWSGPSIALHWLTALLVLGLLGVGLFMTELPNNPTKVKIYALHKSLGLTVLALVALRLLWRLYAGAPAPLPGTPRWQHLTATLVHWTMYALLIAVPLAGWAYNSASNFPLQWFGQFNLPRLVAPDPEMRAFWRALHGWLALTLALLALGHAAAALKHHYLDRDDTLRRMLPRFGRRTAGGAANDKDKGTA